MQSSAISTKPSNVSPVQIVRAEFERPAESVKLLPPPGLPEVAFVGRSNVGKSSLLNALCRAKKLARTSRTPGRTQALNFFHIEYTVRDEKSDPDGKPYHFECYFVDLPGFGYAKVSKDLKKRWRELIGRYLFERSSLESVVLLIDSRRDPGEEELWLVKQGKAGKLWVVLTKCDKLTRRELKDLRGRRAAELKIPVERVIPVSVTKKECGDLDGLREGLLRGLSGVR